MAETDVRTSAPRSSAYSGIQLLLELLCNRRSPYQNRQMAVDEGIEGGVR